MIANGVERVICTDISKDGLLAGTNSSLYENLIACFPTTKFIASGGVGSVQDIETLKPLALEGVIVGKAIYENKISTSELKRLAC